MPPPLKSPWAEVVRQHAKPKDGAVKETSPKAPAALEGVQPAASQTKDRQAQRSKDLPSYARTGPTGASQYQQRPAEASARGPARNAPQPAAPNAAIGGRASASVKTAQPKPVTSPPVRPSTPAVSVDALPCEPESDAMSSSSTADKGTPRQHQEVSSTSINAIWVMQHITVCKKCIWCLGRQRFDVSSIFIYCEDVVTFQQEPKPHKPAWKTVVSLLPLLFIESAC